MSVFGPSSKSQADSVLPHPVHVFGRQVAANARRRDCQQDVDLDRRAEVVAVREGQGPPQGVEEVVTGESGFFVLLEENAVEG